VATFESPHPILQRRPTKTAVAVGEFVERVVRAKPQA
jgi:hypothetical protein